MKVQCWTNSNSCNCAIVLRNHSFLNEASATRGENCSKMALSQQIRTIIVPVQKPVPYSSSAIPSGHWSRDCLKLANQSAWLNIDTAHLLCYWSTEKNGMTARIAKQSALYSLKLTPLTMVIVSSLILFPVYGKWGKFTERGAESVSLTEPRLSGLPWFSLASFHTVSPFVFFWQFRLCSCWFVGFVKRINDVVM